MTMPASKIDVLIIAARKEEYDEACKVADGALDDWTIDRNLTGFEVAFRSFNSASGVPLRIALTWATRMRTTATTEAAGRLIDKLGVRCLAMCGVCAGRRGKVQAGDVIIASLLYTYDTGSIRTEVDADGERRQRFLSDPDPYPLNERWLHRAQAFDAPKNFSAAQWLMERPRTLQAQTDWLLERLRAGDDPLTHADSARFCPAWKSVIERARKLKYVTSQGPLVLTESGIAYIDDLLLLHRSHLPEAPPWRIHVAPIATGNNVMRDPQLFERLEDSMREVLGVDMEAAAIGAIAHARQIPWVVMKGVMDHADDDKEDGLKPFAARAAAESLVSFLRENRPSDSESVEASGQSTPQADRYQGKSSGVQIAIHNSVVGGDVVGGNKRS